LFKEFGQVFHAEVNRLRHEENATVEAEKTELGRIDRRIRKLVKLITEDDAPVNALKDELRLLEACATSHHWAREIEQFGHRVRLMPKPNK
jgi:predicted RNase H-like nuclease (RuvC/YqgF family)